VRVIYVPRDMVEDTIFCSGDGLEQKLIKKDMLHKIKTWLCEDDYMIVYLYYFKQYRMKQIGSMLGVSEGWISQVHKRVINNLRKEL
jgi:RNA polymerase sigma factor (sigma-70 family)